MLKMCQRCVKKPHALSRGIITETMLNCDIFVDGNNFVFYAKGFTLRLHSLCGINRDNGHHVIDYNTETKTATIKVDWLPEKEPNSGLSKSMTLSTNLEGLELGKLERVTDQCRLQINNGQKFMEFEANFSYGYNFLYTGKLQFSPSDIMSVCIPEPHLASSVKRYIDRKLDENKHFSHEEYKLNVVELQVPEGHDDPMNYKMDFSERACELTIDEERLAHNICIKAMIKDSLQDDYDIVDMKDDLLPEDHGIASSENDIIPCNGDFRSIDCGLVSILLAICYDVRTTSNETTCESAWTRNTLSATLKFFDCSGDFVGVVLSFLRRSLIYPLYRNYELGCLCVQDAIDALETRYSWILKQLLKTYELFANRDSQDNCRAVLNHYYIRDYILLMYKNPYDNIKRFEMVATELQVILSDMNKDDLNLDLLSIERELFDEIFSAWREVDDNDYSDNDDCDTSDEDDNESNKSATETNSSDESSCIETTTDAEIHGSEIASTAINGAKADENNIIDFFASLSLKQNNFPYTGTYSDSGNTSSSYNEAENDGKIDVFALLNLQIFHAWS